MFEKSRKKRTIEIEIGIELRLLGQLKIELTMVKSAEKKEMSIKY